MTNTPDWQQISKQIEKATKQPFLIKNSQAISGGCINSAYVLHGENSHYFIKLNQAELLSMFEAEFAGLKELELSKTVKVPQPLIYGLSEDKAYLVMEMLSFSSGGSQADKTLGQQLAQLHQIQQPFFGWHQDNTIGSTKQVNHPSDNWITFWRDNRLGFQLSLAEQNGYAGKLLSSGEKLSELLPSFFSHYTPQPSLLHGDLWSGNASVSNNGVPVIYDPACYYGDREADIAMTELFGGFSAGFYSAYNEVFPLDSDYRVRKTLYNLYHILNHLNLFGSGYLHQAQNMMDSLISNAR